jgi:hypothetical protein
MENYNQYLIHLEKIWNLKVKCKNLSIDSNFDKVDVRNLFFNQISNSLNDYYVGSINPFLINRLEQAFIDGVIQKYFPNERENHLISNLGFLNDFNYLKIWHDKQKLNLIFSLWIVFEDNIDLLYSSLISEKEIETENNRNFNKIKNIIERHLDDFIIEEVKSKLEINYIGINNKFNLLLNHALFSSSKLKKKEMRNFLEFYNSLRNTFHSNSRSLKNKKFVLPYGSFSFKKNEPIDFFTLEILVKTTENLINVFETIRTSLKYPKIVLNPISQLGTKI